MIIISIQYATYNDDSMESGKFYLVEVNKDLVSNLREITTITQPISQNTQEISNIKGDISDLKNSEDNIIDNTNRINILEDRTLDKELLYALNQSSIKYTFVNETRIEITHNRKEIYLIKIMKLEYENLTGKKMKNITAGCTIFEEETEDQNGIVVSKKLILDFGNIPISGYALII